MINVLRLDGKNQWHEQEFKTLDEAKAAVAAQALGRPVVLLLPAAQPAPQAPAVPSKPVVGRIVMFKLPAHEVNESVNYAPVLPAVIVRVFNEETGCCNLKLLNDGPADIWKTSAIRGDSEGQWSWPTRS